MIANFVNISEQKEHGQEIQHNVWCVTSEVEYFDWLNKQPVNQVPSTEHTLIYSKVVMLCGCHSLPKPVKNLVLYCTTCCIFVLVIWTLLRELNNTK